MSRAITLENGTKIKISEESYKELQNAVEPKLEYFSPSLHRWVKSSTELKDLIIINFIPWIEFYGASEEYDYFVKEHYQDEECLIYRCKKCE